MGVAAADVESGMIDAAAGLYLPEVGATSPRALDRSNAARRTLDIDMGFYLFSSGTEMLKVRWCPALRAAFFTNMG